MECWNVGIMVNLCNLRNLRVLFVLVAATLPLALHKLSEQASLEAAWIKALGATALFSPSTMYFVLSCP